MTNPHSHPNMPPRRTDGDIPPVEVIELTGRRVWPVDRRTLELKPDGIIDWSIPVETVTGGAPGERESPSDK